MALTALLGLTAASCTQEAVPAQAAAPQQKKPAPPLPLLGVELTPVVGERPAALAKELVGLHTALLELGLGDLPEVVPFVTGAPPPPSLAETAALAEQRWIVEVRAEEGPERVRVHVRACAVSPAEPSCHELGVESPRGRHAEASAQVLEQLAQLWDRGVAPETAQRWRVPVSRDRYAQLLCGRAAATVYGLMPAPAPGLRMDRRRDPMARALVVDPSMALCQALSARALLEEGRIVLARAGYRRAQELLPDRVLLRADLAAARAAEGDKRDALGVRDALQMVDPAGPLAKERRFTLLRARALVRTGQWAQAMAELDRVPQWAQALAVVDLQVQIHDAGGPVPDPDGVLERWQQAAPAVPEPVHRRVMLRVRAGKYDEALTLLPELALRAAGAGSDEDVRPLGWALSLAAGKTDEAARLAETAGRSELARRIRVSETKGEAPEQLAALEGVPGPDAHVLRASLLLESGRVEQALREAEKVQSGPFLADALVVRARAFGRAGRTADEQRAVARLWQVDPGRAEQYGPPRAVPSPGLRVSGGSVP